MFEAENVRDFGWASSRKFIWDAMAVDVSGKTVMAYSYYPKEGNPLWEQYSTRVVAHSLKVYSKYTIDYIYPQATSVHAKSIGMEYPMICFNFGRPESDGTYSQRTKYGMIGVIIHEVGHNFFPMIINSGNDDERANDLQEMIDNNEVKAIFCARGGYGTARIVDKIDFSNLKNNPKWIVGYSDVTSLHTHLNNLQFSTLHATMPINIPLNTKSSLDSLYACLFENSNSISCASHLLNKEGVVKC